MQGGLHVAKQSQLVRAAAGHRPAVFKAIRGGGGGTHNKSQLANQLDYLTTKSTHIVDSSGFLDGKAKLEAGDIKDLTERFAKRWDAGFKPKLGQTTHMLMSFPPIGTRGEDVRDIATDVAERFFQTDDGHFDYIIAVHEDRDHPPHAHLLLNRRSQEGEFFFLGGRNHRFNYDDFRLAMVEEAEKYGVRLEATRRVDRGGVVHYPARTREVYAAKEEGGARPPRAGTCGHGPDADAGGDRQHQNCLPLARHRSFARSPRGYCRSTLPRGRGACARRAGGPNRRCVYGRGSKLRGSEKPLCGKACAGAGHDRREVRRGTPGAGKTPHRDPDAGPAHAASRFAIIHAIRGAVGGRGGLLRGEHRH